ncbi:MAG TPA: hypothetical protein VFI23_10985 [Rhizomicrobium sp.]|nr:hypothetical protein [Rhizomicrobium sp.]
MAPWFGPKSRYDGGIASWQGLVAALVFLPAFFYVVNIFRPADYGWPVWSRHALAVGLIAGLLLLVWAKYDRDP